MKKAITFLLMFILIIGISTPSISYAEEYEEAEYQEEAQENEEASSEEETTEEKQKYDAKGFPIIDSPCGLVMDARTGQIVYEKDGYSKRSPASVTKIMTVLIALEKGKLDDVITLSENAVWGFDRESSHIGLDVGEEIRMEDALYAIMMSSANEASIAVAEHIAGSEEAFCELMNQKAKEIGCTNTNFTNVTGFHQENHYTTAHDIALITKEAMQHQKFLDISACTYYEIPPTNYIDDIRYLTQDALIMEDTSEYYYGYCQGAKHGYTAEANGVLTAWASYDDMQLICVTMGANPSTGNYTDSVKLFDYFFYSYYYYAPFTDFEFTAEQLTSVQNLLNKYYDCDNAGTLTLSTDTDKEILIFYDTDVDEITKTLNLSADNIEQNIIGTLDIKDDKNTYLSVPVSFSGYIKSNDPEAIRQAYADGTLRKINNEADKKSLSIGFILIIAIVIFFLLPLNITKKVKSLILNKLSYFINNIRKNNLRG